MGGLWLIIFGYYLCMSCVYGFEKVIGTLAVKFNITRVCVNKKLVTLTRSRVNIRHNVLTELSSDAESDELYETTPDGASQDNNEFEDNIELF